MTSALGRGVGIRARLTYGAPGYGTLLQLHAFSLSPHRSSQFCLILLYMFGKLYLEGLNSSIHDG